MYVQNDTKAPKIGNIYSNEDLFTIGHSLWEKTQKHGQEQPHLVSGRFMKVFYKITTCPRPPLLNGPKSGCCLIQVWLYLNLNKSVSWFSSGISLRTAFYLTEKFITTNKVKIQCKWYNVNHDLLSIHDRWRKPACQ